jgi:hypothetical protein
MTVGAPRLRTILSKNRNEAAQEEARGYGQLTDPFQNYPVHGALHGDVADALQGFLEGLSEASNQDRSGTFSFSTSCREFHCV